MSLSKQKSVDETDFDESSLKFLGKGTYGTVYRVAVEPGKSAVCVKYLKPSNDSDFESLFVKECAILKKLQHLNIIQYHHKIRIPEKRRYGIVTEYCERGTLQNVIMSSSISYTIWMVVDWSEGLFRALKYLQENHTILHRDIKPSNIFMTHTFIPKIGDFGSTKLYEKTTMNSRHTGTDLYMAPETYIEDKNSPKSDEQQSILLMFKKLFNTMEKTRIVPIEKPECPTKLQEMIISGCSFEYKMRPSIAQIIDGFVQLKKEEDIKRFESQRPREDPKQMEIVRPMEFDGSIVKRKNSDDIFALSDDAKKYFGMVTNFVQSNLEKNDLIFHEFVPAILPIDRDDSLEKLLEKRLIYEFHAQYQFYLMTFDLLATLKQTWIGYLDLFDEHEDLLKCQKVLKDGQMWKKGFHFYNYFLNSTKEQWFLVRVEDERSLFLEKSLVKVRWFDGEWVNNQENREIEVHKMQNLGGKLSYYAQAIPWLSLFLRPTQPEVAAHIKEVDAFSKK
ncbi:unnamed protein product, partial [Mesorhabditis belari]|uniref:Protein kinase domain-containing protein n=1 Tax=Mesorhabditis belari TaxID=2138241 RepID=A0AAF3EMT3_9BILA